LKLDYDLFAIRVDCRFVIERKPVHVVVAHNMSDNESIVVMVYEPDAELWEHDFRRRTT